MEKNFKGLTESDEYKWLKPILSPLKKLFKEVIFVSFFLNFLALAVPIFVLQVYDRVISHSGISTLQGLVIGLVAVILFDFILRQSRSKLMQRIALEIDVEVGRQLYEKITSLPLSLIESKSSSSWNILFKDVQTIRNSLSGPSAILLCDIPFAFIFLFVVFIIAYPIAWVLLIILILFLILTWQSSKTISTAASDEKETIITKEGLMSEIIAARTTIKSLNLSGEIKRNWEDQLANSISKSIIRGSKTDDFINIGHGLTMITTIAVTTVGAIAILNQNLTIGALIATNMLSGRLLGPLNQLVGAWKTYATFKHSSSRLNEIFNKTNERKDSSISIKLPKGNIATEELSFRYKKDSEFVLEEVEIKIEPNSLTTLMGPNGSGKSTLMKVLMGLYEPTKGKVILDSADIKQFGRQDLANWIGYVPPENFLFSGTVKENISKPYPTASDEEIVEASKKAQLHKMIIEMPDGYGTQIGEGGHILSSGFRQRIAIARALIKNPPFVFMDEPSANLDKETENELSNSLLEITKYATVLVITHSSAIIKSCSHIAIMGKGRILKYGRKEDVLEELKNLSSKKL